ncbi:hypothetical protein ABIE13_000253 [Ottowia thiooxydans]|uniref:Uncharacterized protein n=1 Tax=Ottowia thiooxydans TaxID=219182 RepID=A0ABV2Q295_9BURK
MAECTFLPFAMQKPNSTSSTPVLPIPPSAFTPSTSLDSYHTATPSNGDRHIVIGDSSATDSLPWALSFHNFDLEDLDFEDLELQNLDEGQPLAHGDLNAPHPTQSVMPPRLLVGTLQFPSLSNSLTQDSCNGASSAEPSLKPTPPELNRSGR